MGDDKRQRIIQARLKLRDRYKARIAETPSLKDEQPQGSGPENRHGMPRLPVGQHETKKWPVLDLGEHPDIDRADWVLSIDGAVKNPLSLAWTDLLELDPVDDIQDFHCVTTWSRFDLRFRGVRCSTVCALADLNPLATHIMCHAADGYTTNLSLEEALKDDVLLVYEWEGRPLPREHGGPVRMVTPQLYAWKGAKWITRIEVMTHNRPGYWEDRGYSDTAYPWRNDRYS